MGPRTGSAVAASMSCSGFRKRGTRSFVSVLFILLAGILTVSGIHATIATAPSGFAYVMGGSGSFFPTGDAPNSSICRKNLKKAAGYAEKCVVARDSRECRFDSGFISYLEFQYCKFSSPAAPTIIMVLWLFTLLGAFAVIADSFFSPSLIALARSMHMSQNLAGVTLLAFGNGATDVFSAVTAITTGDPRCPDEGLGLGFLMGSGLLVNTVTAGLVMIIRPFTTNRRPFIKDVLFYMTAVCWSAAILIRRSIHLQDSIGFIMLYLLYVVTTWAGSHVRQKKSNTEVYQRCATCLKSIKNCIICKRTPPVSESTTDVEEKSSWRCTWWLRSMWLRLQGFFMSSRTVSDALGPNDTFELGVKVPSSLRGQEESAYTEKEVKMTGFRKRGDHLSSSKGVSHNGSNVRSPLCFPRIEVTAPPSEYRAKSGGTSSTSKSLPSIRRSHVGQQRDLLEVPSGRLHPSHPLTPPPHSAGQKTIQFQASKCLTPPTSVSRRGSATTASHSVTVGSSFRKRSSVGGIGLRSRTPSIYQRRGSRRISAVEQLPFVVRWIIATEEAEGKDGEDATTGGEESARESHTKRSLDIPRRYRNASDATQAGDLSSMHAFSQDVSQSRSSTVSFVEEQSARDHFLHFPNTAPRGSRELHRISSVSLPDLEDVDKAYKAQSRSSSHSALSVDLSPKMPKGILDKVDLSRDEERGELKAKVVGEGEAEEEEEEEGDEYVDPFVKWASRGMWHHLLYCLCPVEISEWQDLSIPVKLIQIIQAPIFILFRLTIPVVYENLEPAQSPTGEGEARTYENVDDYDQGDDTIVVTTSIRSEIQGDGNVGAAQNTLRTNADANEETRSYGESRLVDFEDLHGWCRLLNCFQCLITPMLWVLLFTFGGMPIGLYKVGNSNLPVVVIVLLISTGLAITIFVTSQWDRAPTPYHRPLFATLGFLTSIVWIYAIAHELVNSLETLGIVWEISEAILGITVMALASSISDLMSNSLLAYNGYPRIAFAACIGSPLFNLLIGAGVSYSIKLSLSEYHKVAISFTLTHALLFSFLMGVLTTNVIVALATGFRMRRAYGITLLCSYAIFMVLAILVEADVIVAPPSWQLVSGTE